MYETERIVYGLASGFCTALRCELTDKEFAALSLVPNLNPADYHDANELMRAAWHTVVGPQPPLFSDPTQTALWNAAWELAVRNRFDLNKWRPASESESTAPAPDAAAEFAIALSIYEQFSLDGQDVSSLYNGADELLRRCMRIGRAFEAWCCTHVNFDELTDVWPYLLQDRMGQAVEHVTGGTLVPGQFPFDTMLALAVWLKLPVRVRNTKGASFSAEWEDPSASVPGCIKKFQVRTIRRSEDGQSVEDYTHEDVAYLPLEDTRPVLFALYGAQSVEEPVWEFLFERESYAGLYELVRRLLPEAGSYMPGDPVMQYPETT